MSLRVYALIRDADAGIVDGIRGVDREPLALVRGRALAAVVGVRGGTPGPRAVTRRALERHDSVVRRVARRVPAILPARFGSSVPADADVRAFLQRHRRAIDEALDLVDGRMQMTLRIRRVPGARTRRRSAPPADTPGPGRAYLLARAARPLDVVPELAPACACWAPLVRAERGSRPRGTGDLLTVYHLIDQDGEAAYRRAVARGRRQVPSFRLHLSGPFPPYAFAAWLL